MAKVKMKSLSAAKKRFKRVGKGKVKRAKAYRRHLLTKKGPKRRRDLRQGGLICAADLKNILSLLPR
ncbi:MAG: 50S ribosomal protein L35 [Candidatus Dependentiae bacterium]